MNNRNSNMTVKDERKEDDEDHKDSKDATFHTAEDSFSSNEVSVSIDCHDGVEENIEAQLPSYFDNKMLDQSTEEQGKRTDQKTKKVYIVALALSLFLVIVIAVGVALGVSLRARNSTKDEGTSYSSDVFPGPDDYAGPGGDNNSDGSGKMGPKEAYYNANKDSTSTTTPIKTKPADDRLNGGELHDNIDDITAALSSMPPPRYADSPPSPSCSRPPAWADDDMSWSDLSNDQRQAALYLGYTSTAWDADDDAIIDFLYANFAWDDLTSDQRIAFAYLGYNSGSYENFYNDYFFDELPVEVQVAADAVGYTQRVWDECEAEVCVSGVDDMFWSGIARADRTNLKVLGYDCWTWNNYDVGGAQ